MQRINTFLINDKSIEKYGGRDGLVLHLQKSRYAECRINLKNIWFFESVENISQRIQISNSDGCYVEDKCLINKGKCNINAVVKILKKITWIERLDLCNVTQLIYSTKHGCRSGLKEITYRNTSSSMHYQLHKLITNAQCDTLCKLTCMLSDIRKPFPQLQVLNVSEDNDLNARFLPNIRHIVIDNKPLRPHTFNLVTKTVYKSPHIELYKRCFAHVMKTEALVTLILCLRKWNVSKDMVKLITSFTVTLSEKNWKTRDDTQFMKGDVLYSFVWTNKFNMRWEKFMDVERLRLDVRYIEEQQQTLLDDIAKARIRIANLKMKHYNAQRKAQKEHIKLLNGE